MESTVGQRLKELMKSVNIKHVTLAEQLGVSPQSVSQWVRGVNSISPEHMKKITEIHPDWSYEWLMTGRGNKYASPPPGFVGELEIKHDYREPRCMGCITKQARIDFLEEMLNKAEAKVDMLNRELGSRK